jgi:hypothetical protein
MGGLSPTSRRRQLRLSRMLCGEEAWQVNSGYRAAFGSILIYKKRIGRLLAKVYRRNRTFFVKRECRE